MTLNRFGSGRAPRAVYRHATRRLVAAPSGAARPRRRRTESLVRSSVRRKCHFLRPLLPFRHHPPARRTGSRAGGASAACARCFDPKLAFRGPKHSRRGPSRRSFPPCRWSMSICRPPTGSLPQPYRARVDGRCPRRLERQRSQQWTPQSVRLLERRRVPTFRGNGRAVWRDRWGYLSEPGGLSLTSNDVVMVWRPLLHPRRNLHIGVADVEPSAGDVVCPLAERSGLGRSRDRVLGGAARP